MNYQQFCNLDDATHEIEQLEAKVESAQSRAEEAEAVVWSIVERLQPKLLVGISSSEELMYRLYELDNSDGIAEMIVSGLG